MFFTKGNASKSENKSYSVICTSRTVHNNEQQYQHNYFFLQTLMYEQSNTETSVNIFNDDTDKLLSENLEIILRLKK